MSEAKATIIAAIISVIGGIFIACIPLVPQIMTLRQENSALVEQNDALQAEAESNSDAQVEISALEKRISDLETANSTLRQEKSQIEANYATVQANYDAALAEIDEKDAMIATLKAQSPAEQLPSESETESLNWIPPYMVNKETLIYDGSDKSTYFTVAGNKQSMGVLLRAGLTLIGSSPDAFAIWNTNGRYTTMTFMICSVGEQNADMEIDLDGDNLTTYHLKWDDPPKKIEIPLNGCSNVKINISQRDSNKSYGVYDITFS